MCPPCFLDELSCAVRVPGSPAHRWVLYIVFATAPCSGCIPGEALLDVKGRVTDEAGNPVSGAKIEVKASSKSDVKLSADDNVTDDDGNFGFLRSFSPYSKKRVFVLSVEKSGYKSESFEIGERFRDSILLKKDDTTL